MTDHLQLWNAGKVVIKSKRGRKVTCFCGTCFKCKRREYAREYMRGIRRPQKTRTEETRRIDRDGYVQVRVLRDDPLISMANHQGQISEHRLVMARHLGRPLDIDEFVHHRNGDKTDNQLDNLELWTRSHPNGQRVEDKLKWAIAFVERYDPEFFWGVSTRPPLQSTFPPKGRSQTR